MEDMQSQLNAVLNNPEMMEKVKAFAQNLGQSGGGGSQETSLPVFGDIDPGMIQKLTGLAGKTGVDANQKTLLQALRPYLSRQRLQKLEKAMRAAKMAGMAGLLTGR